MNELAMCVQGWEGFLFNEISQLTPLKVAYNPHKGKKYLVYLGKAMKRPIYPYEEKAHLETLARSYMDGFLGYIEFSIVRVIEGTSGYRIQYMLPHAQ